MLINNSSYLFTGDKSDQYILYTDLRGHGRRAACFSQSTTHGDVKTEPEDLGPPISRVSPSTRILHGHHPVRPSSFRDLFTDQQTKSTKISQLTNSHKQGRHRPRHRPGAENTRPPRPSSTAATTQNSVASTRPCWQTRPFRSGSREKRTPTEASPRSGGVTGRKKETLGGKGRGWWRG